jgi:carboxynorspermidine decarboxylase
MPRIQTPYYLLDEKKLRRNLRLIQQVRERSGARSVLALKCFSTWCVFDLMREYLDGTTSSGVYEARLGREKFGKEVHAYSVGFSRQDVRDVREFADKIIFNSLSQFEAFGRDVRRLKIGLRVNPGFSYSHYDLADPARRYSRLGIRDTTALRHAVAGGAVSGLMFHLNCENDDFANFAGNLDRIGTEYGDLLAKLEWVSLGGGIFFTKAGYPLAAFCRKLKEFSERFAIQVYLEPGEASITGAGELVTTVLDVVHNEVDVAIVDAALEAHMLDHLIYRTTARLVAPAPGPHRYLIAGRSCLAGDVFGEYRVKKKLKPGDIVRFGDAAGYTMVKKNWFNGIPMPAIAVRRLDGSVETVRTFGYEEFVESLS